MALRVYISTDKRTGEERYVKASNEPQVRRYVSQDMIDIRPATALDVAEKIKTARLAGKIFTIEEALPTNLTQENNEPSDET